MCLVLFAHRAHPDFPLIVAANRDEFLSRPTSPLGFWANHRDVLAGRDLVAGGTWLGFTRGGRFGAVTNVREPAFHAAQAPSRGALVAEYLVSNAGVAEFAASLAGRSSELNGFNLLIGSPSAVLFVSNRGEVPGQPVHVTARVDPGIHGLSNASLDTDWPKVAKGRAELGRILESGELHADMLLEMLSDESLAPDDRLPDTGVGIELERALSAARIRLPQYGTRASSVIMVSTDGHVSFVERTWPRRDGVPETRRYRFRIESLVAQP